MAQCPDEALPRIIAPDANSIAVIVRHLSGNLRSRWTDFLTTDGEKPTRNRDDEFVEERVTRETILTWWENGWVERRGALGAGNWMKYASILLAAFLSAAGGWAAATPLITCWVIVFVVVVLGSALCCGIKAFGAWWGETIESFEDALGEIAPHLDKLDRGWRKKAKNAVWPVNLTDSADLVLHKWHQQQAHAIGPAEEEIYQLARQFYREPGVLSQPHQRVARKLMRRAMDLWATWLCCWPIRCWFQSYFNKQVINRHRETLIMMPYLEIALAETLADMGASPGRITRWASLGQRCPALCKKAMAAYTYVV